MKEMLIKLYELNERYHDIKEKMAWLASSLYAAFSFAILRVFFIEGIQKIINDCPWKIMGFLSVVCGCALWFINIQYKKKRISVGISDEFMKILSNQTLSEENKLEQMFNWTKEINANWKRYKKKHKKGNKYILTEWPINILIGAFFISQILITLYLKGLIGG